MSTMDLKKGCRHIETAYCVLGGLADGRPFQAEVCACGTLINFRVAVCHRQDFKEKYHGASVRLLPPAQRTFRSGKEIEVDD
jgi:hypothetical protein